MSELFIVMSSDLIIWLHSYHYLSTFLICRYLNNLPDTVQYPAARSASSDLELMNKANMRAREKSTVDIVNATLLLIEMEWKRFISKQEVAWQSDDVFYS